MEHLYWLLAVCVSYFVGLYAGYIFTVDKANERIRIARNELYRFRRFVRGEAPLAYRLWLRKGRHFV